MSTGKDRYDILSEALISSILSIDEPHSIGTTTSGRLGMSNSTNSPLPSRTIFLRIIDTDELWKITKETSDKVPVFEKVTSTEGIVDSDACFHVLKEHVYGKLALCKLTGNTGPLEPYFEAFRKLRKKRHEDRLAKMRSMITSEPPSLNKHAKNASVDWGVLTTSTPNPEEPDSLYDRYFRGKFK